MQVCARTGIPFAILFLGLAQVAAAQENPAPPSPPSCPAGQQCPMGHDPAAMQAHHAAMMEQHEAGAARIQELQEQMHAATGDAKVAAMEALLDELLAQHRAMHERMMGMHHPGGEMPEGMEPGDADD